jgi:hypothetical protein
VAIWRRRAGVVTSLQSRAGALVRQPSSSQGDVRADSGRSRIAGVTALGAAFLVASLAPASAGGDAPTVSWKAASVEATVARTEALDVTVAFTASQRLKNVELRVVPALAPYLQVAPQKVASVPANTSVSVTLAFAVPSTAPLSTISGTVQVLAGGKNQSKPLPVKLHVGARLGASGGSLSSADDRVALAVPEGALSVGTVVTIEPTTGGPPADFGTAVTPVYNFGPDGTVFAKPVTLTFTYDPAALPPDTDVNDLRVAFQNADVSWQGLPTAADTAHHTVTAATMHFSKYGVIKPSKHTKIAPVTHLAVSQVVPSGAQLSWMPPADDRYAFASIYRAQTIDEPFSLLAFSTSGATSYLDAQPLGAGSCYEVRSVDKAGFESESSGVVACLPVPPPASTVLFDKTNAPYDAGNCHAGTPGIVGEGICGQQFSVSGSFHLRTLAVRLYAIGTVADGVFLEVRADNGSVPGSVVRATSDVLPASAIPPLGATDAGIVSFTFSSGATFPAGTYWLVMRSTGGPSPDRAYAILLTFDRDPALSEGEGTYESDTQTISNWGLSSKMWRAKLTVEPQTVIYDALLPLNACQFLEFGQTFGQASHAVAQRFVLETPVTALDWQVALGKVNVPTDSAKATIVGETSDAPPNNLPHESVVFAASHNVIGASLIPGDLSREYFVFHFTNLTLTPGNYWIVLGRTGADDDVNRYLVEHGGGNCDTDLYYPEGVIARHAFGSWGFAGSLDFNSKLIGDAKP